MTAPREERPNVTAHDLLPPRRTRYRRRLAAVLSGVTLAVATAACGSSGGSASPTPGESDTAASASSPADRLNLAVSDPCRILEDSEAGRLGVGDGTLVTSPVAIGRQACRMTNFPDKPDGTPGKTFLVQVLDNPGRLTGDAGAVPPTDRLPTTRGTPPGATAEDACVYVVDLTPQQTPARYLWVQYADLAGDDPSMNHQSACANAGAAATAAVRSLNQT
jgi:hypothetical protein